MSQDILVWNGRLLNKYRDAKVRPELEEAIRTAGEEWISETNFGLTNQPMFKLWLYLLNIIPEEHCQPGNAIVASYRCSRPELSASVARLFLRRLYSDTVWDGQTNNIITTHQLENNYLSNFPMGKSDELSDEAHTLFSEGELWLQSHPDYPLDWQKTLAHARYFSAQIKNA